LGSPAKPIDFPLDQAPDVVRPEPGKTEWKLRFREANAGELLVVISTRTARNRDPKAKTIWPVGPFAALDVAQQAGTIRVKSPPHIRAAAALKGDTQRADGSDEAGADAVYRYRSLPAGANNLPGPPLELEIRAAAGVVQTRVHHHLQLGEGGWRLHSELHIMPIRTEVETLDVEVPVPGVFEAATPKLVEGIVPLRDAGPQRRVIQIRLAAPQRAEFTLMLEGFYPLPLGAQEATVNVPRLLNVFDRSGQVSVAIPEGFDLRGSAYQWEIDKPGTRAYPLEPPAGTERPALLTADVGRSLSHVELNWKPLRSDIRVDELIDITFGDRQGRVVQVMHYVFADRPSRRLRLRGPPLSGVTVDPGSVDVNGPGDWYVNLPTDPLKDATITVSFGFSLPVGEEASRLTLPLVWPEGVSACESRVRLWRDPAAIRLRLPSLEPGDWQELPPEIVPKQPTLPLLVARASGTNVPLAISLREESASSPSVPTIWIDRTLIQAQTGDGGQQYRARFHLSAWQARVLELDLPAGASRIEARINGLPAEARDGAGDESTRLVRLALPGWRDREHALVELSYHTAGERGEGPGGLVMRWQPPIPRGRVAVGSVRWQVAIPAGATPLSLGDSAFEERWVIHHGLAQPAPAFGTADLEKWIANGEEPGGSSLRGWEMADAGVTARQASLAPLRVVVVPRMIWLFAVSVMVLTGGLMLSRMPRRAVGVLLALLTVLGVIVGFMWPQPAGQVAAAAEPGLLILVLVLCFQHYLHWRYRRRLARMPGFSRTQSESALARNNGRRSAQTSTVDVPAAS
jgi:hypothetical protein